MKNYVGKVVSLKGEEINSTKALKPKDIYRIVNIESEVTCIKIKNQFEELEVKESDLDTSLKPVSSVELSEIYNHCEVMPTEEEFSAALRVIQFIETLSLNREERKSFEFVDTMLKYNKYEKFKKWNKRYNK